MNVLSAERSSRVNVETEPRIWWCCEWNLRIFVTYYFYVFSYIFRISVPGLHSFYGYCKYYL